MWRWVMISISQSRFTPHSCFAKCDYYKESSSGKIIVSPSPIITVYPPTLQTSSDVSSGCFTSSVGGFVCTGGMELGG